jgi:hypothetical protein
MSFKSSGKNPSGIELLITFVTDLESKIREDPAL